MFETKTPQFPSHTAVSAHIKMTAEQCLDVIHEADTMKAYYDSRKAIALAQFAELRQPTRPSADLADGASEEVAMEMGVSPHAAATQLLEARNMVNRLPATLQALSVGRIDYRRAQTINELTTVLSERDARRVELQVLAGGRRANPNKFRDAVRYQVIKADPEAAELRRQAAREHRNVIVRPTNDGMARLTAHLTADESMVAHHRITTLARQRKPPERTLAQCRADVLMDMILNKEVDATSTIQMDVTVPLTTLMGLNQNPGEISGYGPITAEHARELSKNALWRRVVTDPVGVVVEINPRGYESPFIFDYIRTRDRVCRTDGGELPTSSHEPTLPKRRFVDHSRMCAYHSTSTKRPSHLVVVANDEEEPRVAGADDKPRSDTQRPGGTT